MTSPSFRIVYIPTNLDKLLINIIINIDSLVITQLCSDIFHYISFKMVLYLENLNDIENIGENVKIINHSKLCNNLFLQIYCK